MQLSCNIPDFIIKTKQSITIPQTAFVCQQMEIDVGSQLSLAAYATKIVRVDDTLIIDILDATADKRMDFWFSRGGKLRPLFMSNRLLAFTISKPI